jgi:hypothetical protein
MPVVKEEYVLARRVLQRSRVEMPRFEYLEEKYAAEKTTSLDQAYRTYSIVAAETRLAELQAQGYAKGFKVAKLKLSVTGVK